MRITHGSRDTFPCPANRRFWLSSYGGARVDDAVLPPFSTRLDCVYLPTNRCGRDACCTSAAGSKRDHPCVPYEMKSPKFPCLFFARGRGVNSRGMRVVVDGTVSGARGRVAFSPPVCSTPAANFVTSILSGHLDVYFGNAKVLDSNYH